MANDTVWIIVPVYNAQKTLKKCVRSIQKQTYKNWKLVLVDDGSKDKSGEMCDKLAAKDDRIIAIHQQNAGPAAARKTGVSCVPDDELCCFFDSDDEFPENSIETLLTEMIRTGADLVCGKMQRRYKSLSIPKQAYPSCFLSPGKYNRDEMMSKLYIGFFDTFVFPVGQSAKLYKADKLKEVMLNEILTPQKYAEDWDINLRLMPLLDSVSIIDEIVYYYQMGGGTSRFMPTFLSDVCFMYNRKKEYKKHYIGNEDITRNIANGVLSYAISYLIMCERYKQYPQGSLIDEAKHICSLPEIQDALSLLGEDDSGHFIGTGKAFVNNDYQTLAEFAHNKAEERKWKDKIIRILFR